MSDPELLNRAAELNRHPVQPRTHDLLVEAAKRQMEGLRFSWRHLRASAAACTVGLCIDELELIAKTLSATELANRVIYLPI